MEANIPSGPKKDPTPYDHVLAYLLLAEERETNPSLRADLRQSWLYVYYESQHNPVAFVESSYVVHGYHPDKLWPQLVKNRKGILGPEYERYYDAAGNRHTPERLDIPDYDPTCELASRLQIQQASEPARRGSPGNSAWPPKAPLRQVVNRSEVRNKKRVLYFEELLECGHSHIEFPDANVGNRRRRCRACMTGGAPCEIPKRPVQSEHAPKSRAA